MTTATLNRSIETTCDDTLTTTVIWADRPISTITDYIAFSMGPIVSQDPNDGHGGADDPDDDGDYGPYECSTIVALSDRFPSDEEFRGSGRVALLERCLALPANCSDDGGCGDALCFSFYPCD